MSRFEDKLVLGRWMLHQFGVENLEMLGKTLSEDRLIGFDEGNNTLFLHELKIWIPEENRAVNNHLLQEYDDHIVSHWQTITKKRNHAGNTLYPLYFQYLALLFTEHYLDRYFSDRSALCADLNAYLEQFNQKLIKKHRIEPFQEQELNKLAIWIATGGGKTLIMHCNILQFDHYQKKANKRISIENQILLTPNEGLSLQHKQELDASDMSAELFVKDGGNLYSRSSIQIIDIHKLQETSGDKTVAVGEFESNNLVLVDEGHRGASGKEWLSRRNQLCEEGFSFEYSATFGQAIKAASGTDAPTTDKQRESSNKYHLIQQYAKCILFDYSYKFFHGDGYGKDHFILNLSDVWNDEQTQLYLTGCILSFYQQKKLYKDQKQTLANYLLADPLWVFVGGKVIAKGSTKGEKNTLSDIQTIIQFLARFITNTANESVAFIELFLKQEDDLRDRHNKAIFKHAFAYLHNQWQTDQANLVFADILRSVFNAPASGLLHVVHLKGSSGEVGLRVGENDWFGVINVGDSTGLIKLCEESDIKHVVVTDQSFSSSLFQGINKKDSLINLLIGAKKFTEGWSSWRVATMGFMNVGRSEGSEIIQLFGRGVRLKGLGFSLKRSNHLKGRSHPKYIEILETLNVFGIRSDYMKEFEEYLAEEGVSEDGTQIITLPVFKHLEQKDLKLIRLKRDIEPFKKARKPFLEAQAKAMRGQVILNWYPKIQSRQSGRSHTGKNDEKLNESHFSNKHLAFFDYEKIYFALAQYKNEKAWYNLQLDRQTIKTLLADPSWYCLQIPAKQLEIKDFARIEMWQEIAIALLKKYAERYYHFRKQEYESPHLEYYQLSENDDNFISEYKATINRDEEEWINKISELKSKLEDKSFHDSWSFGNLQAFEFSRHLYHPLIYFKNNEVIKLSPVPLNEGERDFVQDLRVYYQDNQSFFEDKTIYLLRNQSKGKGIGFFEAGNFYPDFILWLIADGKQYVCFIDPKGLTHIRGFKDPKVQFAKEIKNIEKRLNDPDVILDSFIVSNTYQREIDWWSDGNDIEKDFSSHHVLFQKEDDAYIDKIFRTILLNTEFYRDLYLQTLT